MSAALPKGGADRVRFCIWYAAALDEGKPHEQALESAFGKLQLLAAYHSAGIAEKLGPTAAGIPVALIGEDEPTAEQLELAEKQMAQRRAEPTP